MLYFMKALSYVDKKTRQPLYSPIGYFLTEKLDGQRAQWDPVAGQLISRFGNVINAPETFISHFRNITFPLDGELFMGYGNWGLTGIFRSKDNKNPLWNKVQYRVFDLPDPSVGTYLDRMQFLDKQTFTGPISVLPRRLVANRGEVQTHYKEIIARGGEGDHAQ